MPTWTETAIERAHSFAHITAEPGAWRRAAATTTPMVVAIIAVTCVFGFRLGAIAVFGSLVSMWNTGHSLRSRIRRYAVVAPMFPATLALGVWVSPAPQVATVVEVVVVFVVVVGYHTFFHGPGPGPLHLFYACALGIFLGGSTNDGWAVVGVTALSTLLTALVSLTDLAFRGHRAERAAVAAAERLVDEFLRSSGWTGDGVRADDHAIALARRQATAAVDQAAAMLASATSPRRRPSRTHAELIDEIHTLHGYLGAGSLSYTGSASPAHIRTGPHPRPMGRPSALYRLRRTFGRNPIRHPLTVGLRCTIAGAVAGQLALCLAIEHAYWAVLSATIVLHGGLDRDTTLMRATHRVAGTLAGVAVITVVEQLHPAPWVQVVIIACAAWGMNLFLPRNYGLAAGFITIMTLQANVAMTNADATVVLIADRLAATAIGVVVAVLVLLISWHLLPDRTTDRQLIRTSRAAQKVLEHASAGTSFTVSGRKAHRDLRFEALATAEPATTGRGVRVHPDMVESVHRSAYTALATSWQRTPVAADIAWETTEIDAVIDRITAAAASRRTPLSSRRRH